MTVNGGVFDLDGTPGTTTITLGNISNNGSLTLNVDAIETTGNTFNGTIETADAGTSGRMTVNLSNPAESWTMAGTLNLVGSTPLFQPTRVDGSPMIVTGTVNVANNSVAIAADAHFDSTSVISTAGASSHLIMRGVTVVESGADFNGLGTLVNDSGGDMTLQDGLDTEFVDLDNEGTLRLDSSPGQVEVNGFAQTAGGSWEVEVGGPLAAQFDSLTVDSTADLAGTLSLSLLGGYVPDLGLTFDILTAPFGVDGTFDAVLGGVVGSTRLGVRYEPTLVQLVSTFSADFDLDFDVDGADLAMWRGAFGPGGMADADGDGDSDGFDFMVWQRQLGSVFDPLATNVPEPATCAMTLLALTLGLTGCRRTTP
jgi:hypothetical protein